MGYLRDCEWDPSINAFSDFPFVLRVMCDGVHGLGPSTPWREFRSSSFEECIALAKIEGWLIEQGPEPQDGQEIGQAYCPICSEAIDWSEMEPRKMF
jgi:hypothetical protein